MELAKVSLWLDCFTLGAPLSFLDHHLKCGNSLVGVTIGDVEEALRVRHGEHYGTLFGGTEFAGVMSAVEMMKIVGGLPDVTPSQVAESRGQFRKASDQLAPFKEMLDVYTSRWFGNRPTKTKTGPYDPTLEFLRTEDSLAWLKDPSRISRVGPLHRKVREVARAASREQRFFHWQLEFPEAFFGASPASSQVVGLKPEGGFDAVIGNPPYDVLASEELGYDVSDLAGFVGDLADYTPAIRGKNNLYKLFICRGFRLRRPTGGFSFIVPMALLGDDQSAGVRRMLLEANVLRRVEAFPQKDDPRNRVFPEAKLSTTVFAAESNRVQGRFTLRTHPGRLIEEASPALEAGPSELITFDPENAAIPSCSQADWELVTDILSLPGVRRMADVAKQFQGEVNETNERAKGTLTTATAAPLVLRGASVCLYAVREASQGEDIRLDVAKFLKGKDEQSKAFAYRYQRVGFQRKAPQNNFRRLIAAPISRGQFCFESISYCTEESVEIGLDLLLAILNARLTEWYFRLSSSNAQINEYQFNALPAPTLSDHGPTLDWRPLFEEGRFVQLADLLREACSEPGVVPHSVAEALAEMSRGLQEIEAKRALNSRSDRSHLAPEGQPIQDAIDAVLFRCYGVSDDDARYIERRLTEML